MKALVLPAGEPDSLKRAAEVLRQGGLVAFPTETVYGLGADAFNPRAVARIFEAKQRPAFDPLIVHLASAPDLPRVAAGSDARLAALTPLLWPGPLTLVLPRADGVPDLVCAGLPSVAARVPDHPAALELIRLAGPLAAPSANPFGYASPTTAAHVADQLGDRVDLILDGGPCRVGLESTILSLLTEPARLLRPGGVTLATLRGMLGRVDLDEGPLARPQAPGQMEGHYATRTPLQLAGEGAGKPSRGRCGLLAFSGQGGATGFEAVERLCPSGDLFEAAANLFAALRRLDALGLDLILAESCPEKGIGLAIMNRLKRCAKGSRGA